MDKFYKLDYRHPTRVGYEELPIVFFSSLDKVREIINDRMLQPGFKEYSCDCFIVTEIFADEYRWKKGFESTKGRDIEL